MSLTDVWYQQKQYNKRVKEKQQRSSAEWMQTYILGCLSELGQLLDAMRWKSHRLSTTAEFGPNVPEELADVTKYVFSMWILMGYTPEQALEFVAAKSDYLDHLFSQEFDTQLRERVVIFDIDNVLADLQSALTAFMRSKGLEPSGFQDSIHQDLSSSWSFDRYREAKSEFERNGGYAELTSLLPVADVFQALRESGCSIIAFTARPVREFSRIRRDTFDWFVRQGPCALPDQLLFGREERILTASALRKAGHTVILVDDDPAAIKRAQNSGIPYICPHREYNHKFSNFNGDAHDLVAVLQNTFKELDNAKSFDSEPWDGVESVSGTGYPVASRRHQSHA